MGLTHSPQIVRDGLVLYLDAANSKSYPGSGTVFYDLSSSNLVGTIVNQSQYNDLGYMDYIDYSGNNVNTETIVTNVPLNTTAGQGNTVEQWVYADSTQANGNMTFTFYNVPLDLWLISNNFGINNGSSLVYGITNANNIFIGKWNHISVYFPYSWTSDLNSTKIWINGISQSLAILQGTLSSRVVSNSQTVGIGGGYTDGADSFNWDGRIAVTKIYNRELTDLEVKQNFEALRRRFGI